MERRNFIRVSSLAGGGLLISLNALVACREKDGRVVEAEALASELGAFLSIDSSGAVFFRFTKHEMGQGASTALAMILAEELCADWEKVQIRFPDLDLATYENEEHGGHGSGGSTTVLTMTPILRKAGAVAKTLLLKAAALQWNVPEAECTAALHAIRHTPSGKSLGYGELAQRASVLQPPEDYELKTRSDFTLIGKPVSAKLIPDIVTGKVKYAIDVKVPGMLYAVIARCPVHNGLLKSYDASKALEIPGVKHVVDTRAVAGFRDIPQGYEVRPGVAVVAESVWAAEQGRKVLEIEWDEGEHGSRSLSDFENLLKSKSKDRIPPTGVIGEAEAAFTGQGRVLEATYIFPYQVHAPMEPLNCIAHFKGDSCEFWIGSQGPEHLAEEVARDFALDPARIRVHLYPSGGGFGRRYKADSGLEAACISKQCGNIPIKLIWTREDDHLTNLAHIYQRMDYRAILTGQGISAWYEKDSRTYDYNRKTVPRELSWIGYAIPHVRYDLALYQKESPLQSVPWRAVTANGFALSECFIDEIAAQLGQDPYSFRLSMLEEGREVDVGHTHPVSNSRLIRTLKLAVAQSDWGKPIEAGRGRGLAVYPYLHGNGYCAMVAEVTVTAEERIRVDKVVCGVDCGMVINPSGAANQIEGGVIWGMTAMMYGGMEIENGRPLRSNFHQNKMTRIRECPEIEVHFTDDGDTQTWGTGEIANPVIVPAVLNAVYAACGKRIRKLPVSLEPDSATQILG